MCERTKFYAEWTENNRKYYENKGYIFTNYNDLFEVREKDFSKTSKKIIKIKCCSCNNCFDMEFRSYHQRVVDKKPLQCHECIIAAKRDALYQNVVRVCHEKKYVLLTEKDDIIDRQTDVYYICPKHGETHTKVDGLLNGSGCYWCGRENASKHMAQTTLKERQESLYKQAVEAACKKGYTLLSTKYDFVKNTSYLQYVCLKHGLHKMRVANFIYGKGCPDCVPEANSERFRLSPDEVERRVQECGGHLLNKEEYINQTEKNLLIECFECGEPFLTSLRNFTQHGGQVCPGCKNTKSIGESKIERYLNDNHINFIFQKWFEDCRDRNPLPFDFYLTDFNIIIEFDGRQHFEETDHFTYPLEIVQKHDKIKNDYCQTNGIYLIRIPYWDINRIEAILDKELILHEDIV